MASREITAKVEKNRLVFGEGIACPVEQIFIDHPRDSEAVVASFDCDAFPWITLWIHRVENQAWVFDISDFSPKFPGFGKLPPDFSKVWKNNMNPGDAGSNGWKIVLFHDSPKVSALAQFQIKKTMPVRPAPRPEPASRPEPPREYTQQVSFSAPLERFDFLDGAAEIEWNVRFEKSHGSQRVLFRIEHSFFSPKLNCIRSYLAKGLGGKPVEVNATVRVYGGEVTVERITAPELNRITSELLAQVRFNYVKNELRNRSGKRITTADRFFRETAASGFADSDVDFIGDILRAKNTKHATHIEYLASLHNTSQVRLRLIRDPFSFLFFIPGETGSFFVWETIDGTDATYIWKLKPMACYLDGKRGELKQSLAKVERTIDWIHAAGRNKYLKEEHADFVRVFHNYEQGRGFDQWKQDMVRLIGS